MAQIARNLTDTVYGPLRGFTHLIVDRDPLYTAVPKPSRVSEGRPFAATGLQSELERVREKVRSLNQTGMLAAHRSAGRTPLRHVVNEYVSH